MAESKLRTLSIDFAVQILNLIKFLKSRQKNDCFRSNWHNLQKQTLERWLVMGRPSDNPYRLPFSSMLRDPLRF